ncbi:SDR family NAD(P)-dependent oxidoreductase [Denitratisoma oestradiolicum]|nr:SDR family oxidoreductase [Denitratisoma oestradiolicum]
MRNKVIVVTGAGSGMGSAIVQRFGAESASVVSVDLDEATALAAVRLIPKERAIAVGCDVSNSVTVEGVIANVENRFGRVDVLVNCAGIANAPGDGFDKYLDRLNKRIDQIKSGIQPDIFPDLITDMSDDGFWKVLKVDLGGPFYFCREVVRLMIKTNTAGAIVNIASTSAQSGEGPLHYVAAKAGLLGLTKSLARELGPRGIRVNAICPGATNTPMIQQIPDEWRQSMIQSAVLERLVEPDEIAETVMFLASNQASAFTGQTLGANCGSFFI